MTLNVLVCGARGFIGRAVVRALQARGHRVVLGVSPRRGPAPVPGEGPGPGRRLAMDFATEADPATWQPRLAGIDAVVNTVGVLRDTRARPIEALHHTGPAALFEACARAGIRRVVQVSALGIDGSDTPYATTKRAAERALAGLAAAARLDPVVLRPSIVFGRGGASSELFLLLSRLPLLVLPGPMVTAAIQPVAVDELAEVIAGLVDAPLPRLDVPGPAHAPALPVWPAVGPRPVRLADFIASLRAQASRTPARTWVLPDEATRFTARLGDHVPASPWCSDALSLLGQDNVADPAAFAALLGRPATPFDQLLAHSRTPA